jgi:hypothetical protein
MMDGAGTSQLATPAHKPNLSSPKIRAGLLPGLGFFDTMKVPGIFPGIERIVHVTEE